MTKINFEKKALEQQEWSNHFEEKKSIVSLKMWAALLGMFLLVAFIITWAFVDRIPVKVKAFGIFYLSGWISEIVAEDEGILQDIFVREGQAVAKGQILASMQVENQCNGKNSSVLKTNIRAPNDGIVMSIFAYPVNYLKKGSPVFLLFPLGISKRDLVGFAFVSAVDGKKISKDMRAQMQVATASVEEHGKMLGKVLKVSELPTNKEEILSLVKNSQFASAIEDRFKIGPFFVKIKPDLKEDSVTGYRWTLQEPAHLIDPGTVFEAEITVQEKRPIDYVIPIL